MDVNSAVQWSSSRKKQVKIFIFLMSQALSNEHVSESDEKTKMRQKTIFQDELESADVDCLSLII